MHARTFNRWFVAALILTITTGNGSAPAQGADGSQSIGRVIGGATVSARLANCLLSRPIKQTTTIREELMGADTSGTAWTTAQVMAEFIPNSHKAIVNVRLVGTILANNNSQRGRVTVMSGSQTEIDASKRIAIDQGTLEAAAAEARCATSMWIHDVTANVRLIERLARRRVERMRGEIETTTSTRAAREIESQLDAEVAKLTGQMQSGTEGSLTDGSVPVDVHFQTSRDRLFVSLLERAPRRPGLNLGTDAANYDLGFSAHESLIETALEHLVAGKVIADEQFLNVINTITGLAPRPLWVHERRPRWSISMVERTPIQITLTDNQVTVELRIRELKIGERSLKANATIVAQYGLEPTSDGPHLIRQKAVQVAVVKSSDNPRVREETAEIKNFLTSKFNAFFQSDLYFDGMVPPVGGSGGRLRQLQLTRFSSDSGWLVMGYQLPADELAHTTAE